MLRWKKIDMVRAAAKILVTGSYGFIGKNVILKLKECQTYEVLEFVRSDPDECLPRLVEEADFIVHLAGENRPLSQDLFNKGNDELTAKLCEAIRKEVLTTGRKIPLVFASSIQATEDNPYGISKLRAEGHIEELNRVTKNPCTIIRLPGVFGKWCKPNYNSVVATFCHNVARGIPIKVVDAKTMLTLVYIDDVVATFLDLISNVRSGLQHETVRPEYQVTVGELAEQITKFDKGRKNLMIENVGEGFKRALYSTYVSYLPVEKFSYELPKHSDVRGEFVEMLKTPNCGQFSYFTAKPNVTRGGHYHHSKTEKFLVISGKALFRSKNINTGEICEFIVLGGNAEIVDSIPGWAHDITNIGNEDLIVMLWANETFDKNRPDTVLTKV